MTPRPSMPVEPSPAVSPRAADLAPRAAPVVPGPNGLGVVYPAYGFPAVGYGAFAPALALPPTLGPVPNAGPMFGGFVYRRGGYGVTPASQRAAWRAQQVAGSPVPPRPSPAPRPTNAPKAKARTNAPVSAKASTPKLGLIPASALFGRSGEILWPSGLPAGGAFDAKRAAAEEAFRGALDDRPADGRDRPADVAAARAALADYAGAVSARLEGADPRRASGFDRFVRSLDAYLQVKGPAAGSP